MSNSGSTSADSPASRGVPRSAPIEASQHTGACNQRSTGKGRQRRAAAEQRRIDQQRWAQFVGNDDNEDFAVAPAPVNWRRFCRASRRRKSGQEALDDYLNENMVDDLAEYGSFSEDSNLDVALALAISLSGSASVNQINTSGLSPSDMSYENLVLLEDVKVVASPLVVDSLQEIIYEGTENQSLSNDSSGVCAICQSEYLIAEKLIVLSCCHNFHHACGAKWLLDYSKLCPICKHDVTM